MFHISFFSEKRNTGKEMLFIIEGQFLE